MKRLALLMCTAACGTLGGGDGGSENLPNRGIAPYQVKGALFPGARSPSAVVLDENRIRIYFEQDGEIRCAEGDGETFGAVTTVIEDAHSPSAALGSDGVVRISFVNAEGDVAIVREDQPNEIQIAIEGDGRAIEDPSLFDETTVFFADGGKILRNDETVALDHGKAPEVRRATTGLGRTVYRMMYESEDEDGAPEIAFAASFDGATFTDYAQNPILPGGEPSNVRLGDRYLLYFVDTGTIALAIDAPAAPSETF